VTAVTERQWSRSDSGRAAAWGLSCQSGKALTQRIVCPTAASSSIAFPTFPDNPRAVGAAPFSKGELLATEASSPPQTVLPKSRDPFLPNHLVDLHRLTLALHLGSSIGSCRKFSTDRIKCALADQDLLALG